MNAPATDALARFNDAPAAELVLHLLALTAAPQWAEQLVARRPYPGVDDLLVRSDEIVAGIREDQIDAALAGHPRIGEKHAGPAEDSARSAGEQAGMNSADASTRRAIADANAAYEERFGRMYLVAAAGLSADQLLAKAMARLGNGPVTELGVVRDELARITRLRLTALLTGAG